MARRRNNEDILMAYQVGDLIKFPREGYSHYGVYVGDDQVIHFTCQEGNIVNCCNPLPVPKRGEIKREPLRNIVGYNQAEINNFLDFMTNPYLPETIVERAESRMGHRNYTCGACLMFVIWCRYGIDIIKVSGGIAAVVTFLCLVMRRHGS